VSEAPELQNAPFSPFDMAFICIDALDELPVVMGTIMLEQKI